MPPRAEPRVPALAVLVALVALGAAQAAELTGTDRADRLVGTTSPDTIRGLPATTGSRGAAAETHLHGGAGRDAILGQAGPDRIAVQADGARDTVVCGLGLDVVNAEHHDLVADDCEVVTRQLSRDPFTGVGQHETQVEPDSASFGSTIVAVFQSGRIFSGGAEGTGWATSVDAGRTWRRGFLERVDDRASDPVVAYDRRHRTWLIATLGVTAARGVVPPARQPLDRRARLEPPRARRGRRGRGLRQGVARLRHVDVEPVLRPLLPRVPRRPDRPDPHTALRRRRPHVVRARRRAGPVAGLPRERGVPGHSPRRRAARLLQRLRLDRPRRGLDPVGPLGRRRPDIRAVSPGRFVAHRGHRRRACATIRVGGCRRRRHGLRDLGRLPVQPAVHCEQHRPRHLARRFRMDAAASRPVRAGRDRDRSIRPRARRRSLDACSRERRDRRLLGDAVARLCRRARSSTPSSCGRATAARRGDRPPA